MICKMESIRRFSFKTPQDVVAFQASPDASPDGDENPYATKRRLNHAWWVEDRLGGKLALFVSELLLAHSLLCMSKWQEDECELVIGRPELKKYYPFSDEMIEQFLSCGKSVQMQVSALVHVHERLNPRRSTDSTVYEKLFPLAHNQPEKLFDQEVESRARSRAPVYPERLPAPYGY
jgi:hypothetical protein